MGKTGRWEEDHSADERAAVIWAKKVANDAAAPPSWMIPVALVIYPLARYPATTIPVALGVVLYLLAGWWGIGAAGALTAAVLLAWHRWHRDSFDRVVVYRAVGSWRRWWVYRRQWRTTMDRIGLGCQADLVSRRRYRPRLVRTTSTRNGDQVLVELLPRQTIRHVDRWSQDLARCFDQAGCWVVADRPPTETFPARVSLNFTRTPITALVAPAAADHDVRVDQIIHAPAGRPKPRPRPELPAAPAELEMR